jgi:uncharacterized membrane protein
MSTRTTIIVSSIMLGLLFLVSWIIYPMLPDPVASHWGANGEVNGYMSSFLGAFLIPLMTLGLFLLFVAIPNIDPLKANIATFRDTYNIFIPLFILYMAYIHALTLAWNLGYDNFDMGQAILPAMSLLFIFLGVLLGKAKRNFFIGIRTPWTLSSDTVWAKTHQLGSKMFIGAGILTLFTIPMGENGIWVFMALILIAAFVPIVYSYVLWKRETTPQG